MSTFATFLVIVLYAAIVENMVFARALGTSNLMDRTRDYKSVLMLGAVMTTLSILSSILVWTVSGLSFFEGLRSYYRPFVYLGCITVVYVAACLVLRQWKPDYFARIQGLLSGVAFSGALLGIQTVASYEHYTFISTLAYAVGGSLGVVIALLMIISARERLNFSKVPRSFAGLPILLIYIGIVSLAVYGLIGHRLPT